MKFTIARVLSLLASLCAVYWLSGMLSEIGIPSDRSSTSDSKDTIMELILVDLILFLIGLASIAAALRERMRTGLALTIAATPLIHLISSTGFAILLGVENLIPLVLILVMSVNPEHRG